MGIKQTIHVFDVDGTITHGDSFIGLLRHFEPDRLLRCMMWAIMAKKILLGIVKRDLSQAKLALLAHIWRGRRKNAIELDCTAYFNQTLRHDIRLKAYAYIMDLKRHQPGEKIVLLSASCTEWLAPLANYLEAHDLICTRLQYDKAGIFKGLYATPNCKGEEKLRRLLEKYPTSGYEFVCYGNSPADKYLKTISKQFYYRYF